MFSLNGRIRATAIAGLIAAGAFAAPAHAHEAGDILFRVGVTQVRPSQNNGSVLDGNVKLDVNNNVRPSFTLAYMATRNIGIELLGAWPFQHDVSGSGGLGKIGSSKQLPPTLSLQWHILPDSMIQPYIGVGINYTHFFDTKAEGPLKGSNLKLGDSWGVAAQLGADIKINDRWFMNADIRYIDIKSKVTLDGQRVGTARIDPWVATMGIGYRF